MHIVLPPSETKRDGGIASPLDVTGLSFPSLNPLRRRLVNALVALSKDEQAALRALKLGPKGSAEAARNRVLKTAPTMPALDRYTGVLYDALDAATLSPDARAVANSRVLIHSALFGLVRANDLIPAYRLSHDSRIPQLSLSREWPERNATVLNSLEGLIIDARSQGYVDLGPIRAGERTAYLRVVSEGPDGQVRALNHFNKKAKGEFTRSLLESGEDPATIDECIELSRQLGWRVEPGVPGELNLVV